MGILDGVGTGEYQIPARLDPARTDLRDEFMADPLGRHSLDLELALGAMRGSQALPRWILIATEPGRRWVLGIAGRRGEPSRVLPEVFTDLAEAERYVFDLRWQALISPGGDSSSDGAHDDRADGDHHA
jgi:hypothetical protein